MSTNIGKIPKRKIGGWAKEVVDLCCVSRQTRIQECNVYRNFYYTGTDDGSGSVDNEIGSEISRLSSSLFSPVDPRFNIEFDRNESDETRYMGDAAATYLSRDFQRRGVDETFALAVEWSLIESSTFLKLLWNRDGFDPYLVRQNFIGVLQEGLTDLDRQDAFVHTSFLTRASFERAISNHPEERDILRSVYREQSKGSDDGDNTPAGLKQLLIGGTSPAIPIAPNTSNNPALGWVKWMGSPSPMLSPQTLAELIQVDELWVIDNEREDYTTIQVVGDIVIEGKLQRRNLSGIRGRHPFVQITPNLDPNIFWGRSEVSSMMLPQQALTSQVHGINRTMRMQEDPPMSFIGMSGDIEAKRSALMKPGGRLAEAYSPNLKIDNHAPKLPESAIPWMDALRNIFHRSTGFESPASRGMGDQGVRSNLHAESAIRMSTPRLRDRALAVERDYAELGDLGFHMLRNKLGDRFELKTKKDTQAEPVAFTLSQIPDDFRITVDAHSASPAFSDEAKRLAFDLARLKAIDDTDTIRLTHPPREDTLIANAEERHRQHAAMIAAHPELLQKRSGRK